MCEQLRELTIGRHSITTDGMRRRRDNDYRFNNHQGQSVNDGNKDNNENMF